MKPIFFFIDDARFELDNFRQNAAPAFARVEMVYAHGFAQAQELLEGRRPLCFLLDLYGSDPKKDNPLIPGKEDLSARLGEPLQLSRLYEGLEDSEGEAGNRFLRRLYGQVEAWQQAFLLAADSLGQGRAYGLGNLKSVRRVYPWAAALGYSRKALYADAAAVTLAGGDGVLQKPQGGNDEAIAAATREAAPLMARACYQAVDRRLILATAPLALGLSHEDGAESLGRALYRALRALQDGAKPGSEDLQALATAGTLQPSLSHIEAETLLSLHDWLQTWAD